MKWTRHAVLAGIFYVTRALAEPPYGERLNKVHRLSSRLDDQLKIMGFQSAQSRSEIPGLAGENDKKRPSLFQLHDSATRLQAPAGKLLYGELRNRLVVGPEVSPALVVLSSGQGAFSGTQVLGHARQSGTAGRIQIELDRVVFSSGKVQAIKGSALDQAGALGIEAEVFSSKAWAVAGAMGASFISGIAASQQTLSTTALGFTQSQPTGRNAVLQGVAQTAADQSKHLIDEATQERPILVVDPGTQVSVYLDEEVRF